MDIIVYELFAEIYYTKALITQKQNVWTDQTANVLCSVYSLHKDTPQYPLSV